MEVLYHNISKSAMGKLYSIVYTSHSYEIFMFTKVSSLILKVRKFCLEKVEPQIKKSERLIIIGLILIFTLVFILIGYNRHLNLSTALFDLGLQEQVIWNTSNGNWFASSPEVQNFLGDHFSFSLILVALIYKIIPFTFTLIALQAASVSTGIIGFYLIAKSKLKGIMTPLLVFASLLIYIPLSGLLLFDVHEIAFAFPFLVFGILFLEKKKAFWGIVLLLIAMGFKEDVGILVGMIGFYYGLFRKQKWGIALFIFCIIYSLLTLFVFIPYFRGTTSDTLSRYPLLNNPSILIDSILKLDKLKYLLYVFLPVLPVLFVIPESLVLIIPSLLVNLLSNSPFQYGMSAQYDVMVTVAVFFSMILGLAKMQKLSEKGKLLPLQTLVIIGTIVFNLYFLFNNRAIIVANSIVNRSEDRNALIELMADIPKDKNIAVSNNLGAYFGQYPNVYLFDPPWLEQRYQYDYLVIDRLSYSNYRNLATDNEYIQKTFEGNIAVYIKQQPVFQ